MRDHVPYEVWMMRATHDGLTHGVTQMVCWNAYIESFAVHARSLINFFSGKDGSRAEDFADNYIPFASNKVPRRLTEKLNQQIPHITERRFNTVAEKLNLDDIGELRLLIDTEVTRFLQHMQPRYRAMWDEKKGHLQPVHPAVT